MGGVAGRVEAEEALFREHIGLVRAIARRFEGRGVDREDLVQIGSVGLLRAYRSFEPERGFRFSTFAFPVIEGEIREYLRSDGAVKISRSVRQNAARLAEAAQRLGGDVPAGELARAAGLGEEEAALAAGALIPPASLEELAEGAPTRETGYDRVLDRVALSEGLRRLDREERALISLRYERGMTQEKAARVLGMTQTQVSRREKRILSKLRTFLS